MNRKETVSKTKNSNMSDKNEKVCKYFNPQTQKTLEGQNIKEKKI